MFNTQQRRSQTTFYQEDIVRQIDNPAILGIVLRCWHDAEDLPALSLSQDTLMKPLEKGEMGISIFPNDHREIVSESDYFLVDRVFEPGNVCKRRIDAIQSGIVTNVKTRFLVQHAISGIRIDDWLETNDIQPSNDLCIGDYVAHDDWIGEIQEMFDESIVQVANGQLVRLPEISARLTVGDRGTDIIPAAQSLPQALLGLFKRNTKPSQMDTVLAVKHTVLVVSWLAVNQSLNLGEASQLNRPPRFWHGPEMSKLVLLRGLVDREVRFGDRVTLKNSPKELFTRHGVEIDPSSAIEVSSFTVRQTETTVTVLWQDGVEEVLRSTDLVPYLNVDEHDCWPGDHVIWKTEDFKRAAIVQNVDATSRVAVLLLSDGKLESVPVLEIDARGSDDLFGDAPVAFGVHRGDRVFIHMEGFSNGCEAPFVPQIGELEEWAQEPLIVDEKGHMTGWRSELEAIGSRIAHLRGKEPVEDGAVKLLEKNDSHLNWIGEVRHLRIDGLIEVSLPDTTIISVPLQRLSKLREGMEQIEDSWGDEVSDSYDLDDVSNYDTELSEIQNKDTGWHTQDNIENQWQEEEQMDFDDELIESNDLHENQSAGSNSDVILPNQIMADEFDIASSTGEEQMSATSEDKIAVACISTNDDKLPFKRFDILSCAPADHAFFSTVPTTPTRAFLTRLNREYRVLSTSLPDTIIIRTYENRSDLLRSLIIGPENTPYEDAPFVIDWLLNSDFPQTPPVAHFFSWTNGSGRVNPNLYEEGKVCLSILGTWAGDRSESWDAARSSLLQAVISIQGLVLVKEPWYCEPAYEKFRGTEEGMINSEKAYVLSRNFVRRVLETPLSGLEEEIKYFYYTKGKLKSILDTAKVLISKSGNPLDINTNSDCAVPQLSLGGVMTLQRTLNKLYTLLS